MAITGIIHKFGDHVDTDVILPGRYLAIRDSKELGRHCLKGLDPCFAQRVRTNDLVVAGRNFGSGSSREQAPMALKGAGVGCVVAVSFARIFYRNAINIGLPILICPEFVIAAQAGLRATIDLDTGQVDYEGRIFRGTPMPDSVRSIVEAGGLVPYVRRQLGLGGCCQLSMGPGDRSGSEVTPHIDR